METLCGLSCAFGFVGMVALLIYGAFQSNSDESAAKSQSPTNQGNQGIDWGPGLRKNQKQKSSKTRRSSSKTNHSVPVPDMLEVGNDFFVDCSKSPNGRLLAGARDGHSTSGGKRVSGKIALVEAATKKPIFTKSIPRPHSPRVSDDGLVVVEDWKSSGSLSGEFLCFARNGSRKWRHSFKANILESGLSQDGKTAFVSTCNSDHEPHSHKTFVIATDSGEIRHVLEYSGGISFKGNQLGLEQEGPSGQAKFFPIDESGDLPSSYDDFRDAKRLAVSEEYPRTALAMAWDEIQESDTDWEKVETLLDNASRHESDLDNKRKAKLYRYRGELAEARGDEKGALVAWKKALDLDQKVGIKRRFSQLEKELDQG